MEGKLCCVASGGLNHAVSLNNSNNLSYFGGFLIVIAQEKGQQQLRQGIEQFQTANLNKVETLEKNPLPTQEGDYHSHFHARYYLKNRINRNIAQQLSNLFVDYIYIYFFCFVYFSHRTGEEELISIPVHSTTLAHG